MPNNRSSFSNLQNFVTNITNSLTTLVVDPLNTFTCTLTPVAASAGGDKTIGSLLTKVLKFANGYAAASDDFHSIIEDLTLPDVIANGEQLSLLHGKLNLGTSIPLPADNTFKMTVLNLAPTPFIETVIYPWMQAVNGVSSINGTPKDADLNYPRADFTVTFPHLSVLTGTTEGVPVYVYYNVRPISVETYNPSNKPQQSLYRSITFTFDYFSINTQPSA